MWQKIKDRLREPSTYAGLAGVITSVGVLGKINEAPAIADTVANAGHAIAQGDYATAIGAGLFGLLSIFMREKGGR
jgi:hypothetical protein